MNKWVTCFVEWSNDKEKWYLSKIPWRVLVMGYFNKIFQHSKDVDFEWHWVAPWRVTID